MNGQITIWEYMEDLKPIPVDIMGLCDDAYCPKCGRGFLDPQENDLPSCPFCGQRVDWTRWHYLNDNEESGQNE